MSTTADQQIQVTEQRVTSKDDSNEKIRPYTRAEVKAMMLRLQLSANAYQVMINDITKEICRKGLFTLNETEFRMLLKVESDVGKSCRAIGEVWDTFLENESE